MHRRRLRVWVRRHRMVFALAFTVLASHSIRHEIMEHREWLVPQTLSEWREHRAPTEVGPMPTILTNGPSPRWVVDGAVVETGPSPRTESGAYGGHPYMVTSYVVQPSVVQPGLFQPTRPFRFGSAPAVQAVQAVQVVPRRQLSPAYRPIGLIDLLR